MLLPAPLLGHASSCALPSIAFARLGAVPDVFVQYVPARMCSKELATDRVLWLPQLERQISTLAKMAGEPAVEGHGHGGIQ